MDKEKVIYQCFSLPQHRYLEGLGFKSVLKARHLHTNREFWLYLHDEEDKLNNALKQWSQNNLSN